MLDAVFIGERSRAEFTGAFASLAESTRVTWHPGIDAAIASLRETCADPALVVVAVAYPGQFATRDIADLRHLVPLTRIVALLGTWCEGETRTGRPWHANARVFWYDWCPWWRREQRLLTGGRPTSWEMPLTATGQDRVLAAVPAMAGRHKAGGLLMIAADNWATYSAMADALEPTGHPTVWSRAHRPPVCHGAAGGIWDGGQLDHWEQGRLAAFCHRVAPAPVVALFDFPRVETVAVAEALGAAAVLGKPYAVDALVATLAHAVQSRRPPIQVARSA